VASWGWSWAGHGCFTNHETWGNSDLVGGAITILKLFFVNGKDDIPYMEWKIKHVPNHQSVDFKRP